MDKKYILITGVSSGIGYDATRYLLQEGYHVIGSVRKESDRDRLIQDFSENFYCLIFDVTDFPAVENAAHTVKEIIGESKLTALINNAGVAIPGPMCLISDEKFKSQIDVNILSVRKVTNVFLDLLYKNHDSARSKIIFISSISGLLAAPFNGPYCISKHALECMVDIYRRELMIYNIDVVAIQPGPIQTKIWDKNKGSFDAYRNSDYGEIAEKVDQVIAHTEAAALPVQRVSECIYNVLTKDNPKDRYLIHRNGFLFKLIARFMPARWMDKMIWKNLNKKDLKNYRPL